jgi:hypothetical protein
MRILQKRTGLVPCSRGSPEYPKKPNTTKTFAHILRRAMRKQRIDYF